MKESVEEAVDHHSEHIKHLSAAAQHASHWAHKLGSAEAHGHAAHLHDLVHQHTAASATDEENKLSHFHNDQAKRHLYMAAGLTTAPMHHAGHVQPEFKK